MTLRIGPSLQAGPMKEERNHNTAPVCGMIPDAPQIDNIEVNRARPSFLSRPVGGRQERRAQ
jgi:hypothetical protein